MPRTARALLELPVPVADPAEEPERWLPVVDWEGLYEVSDQGRVRSFHVKTRPRLSGSDLLATHRRAGMDYPTVTLSRNAKSVGRTVHSLVAAAFIGPRPPGMDVCHNDGDADNCQLSNLRYGTRSENILDEIAHGTHRHASRTHCAKGHELTDDNIYRCKARPKTRACRTCRKLWRSWSRPNFAGVEGMATAAEAGEILGIVPKSVYVFMTQSSDFPQPTRVRNRLFWDRAALADWRANHPPASKKPPLECREGGQ